MSNLVNVVVTCTKRKSVAIPAELKFRRIRKAPIATKFALWQQRLESNESNPIAVRDLYAGDHWSIARSLDGQRVCRGVTIRIWVASAGYGLVSLSDRIKPYSATFSKSHPDFIASNATDSDLSEILCDWWEHMARWAGPANTVYRTISEVVADSPKSPLLVVASENYLAAIQNDLHSAIEYLADAELLSIYSAGCKSLDGLTPHLLRYDARLQRLVGGALRSLNMRVAKKTIMECGRALPKLPLLQKKINRLLHNQPEIEHFDRQPMTDREVRRFILSELRSNLDARHSPLLRKLRDSGMACEQKRFASLFHQVREQMNAS